MNYQVILIFCNAWKHIVLTWILIAASRSKWKFDLFRCRTSIVCGNRGSSIVKSLRDEVRANLDCVGKFACKSGGVCPAISNTPRQQRCKNIAKTRTRRLSARTRCQALREINITSYFMRLLRLPFCSMKLKKFDLSLCPASQINACKSSEHELWAMRKFILVQIFTGQHRLRNQHGLQHCRHVSYSAATVQVTTGTSKQRFGTTPSEYSLNLVHVVIP